MDHSERVLLHILIGDNFHAKGAVVDINASVESFDAEIMILILKIDHPPVKYQKSRDPDGSFLLVADSAVLGVKIH